MEVGQIGQHCFLCNQLDFLPFGCSDCKQVFCLVHKSPLSHTCLLTQDKTEDTTEEEKKPKKRYENTFKCSLAGCRERQVHPCVCKFCKNNFCLRHRFDVDHHCKPIPGLIRVQITLPPFVPISRIPKAVSLGSAKTLKA